jgi:hypothetical protein
VITWPSSITTCWRRFTCRCSSAIARCRTTALKQKPPEQPDRYRAGRTAGANRSGQNCCLLSGLAARDVRLEFPLPLGDVVFHHTLGREWEAELGVFIPKSADCTTLCMLGHSCAELSRSLARCVRPSRKPKASLKMQEHGVVRAICPLKMLTSGGRSRSGGRTLAEDRLFTYLWLAPHSELTRRQGITADSGSGTAGRPESWKGLG